ncbi:MAG: hypothetical protein FD129_739 [bacterium]|nr:MAG: hypothetical protein FD129_739 [bacterium]
MIDAKFHNPRPNRDSDRQRNFQPIASQSVTWLLEVGYSPGVADDALLWARRDSRVDVTTGPDCCSAGRFALEAPGFMARHRGRPGILAGGMLWRPAGQGSWAPALGMGGTTTYWSASRRIVIHDLSTEAMLLAERCPLALSDDMAADRAATRVTSFQSVEVIAAVTGHGDRTIVDVTTANARGNLPGLGMGAAGAELGGRA